jgi:hypothetical protein
MSRGRFLTILTGRNLQKIRQAREPEPSTINEKTRESPSNRCSSAAKPAFIRSSESVALLTFAPIADFTRVVEQMGILERGGK